MGGEGLLIMEEAVHVEEQVVYGKSLYSVHKIAMDKTTALKNKGYFFFF